MTKTVIIDKKDMPKWFWTEQIEAQKQRAEQAEAERDTLKARVEELEEIMEKDGCICGVYMKDAEK